MKETSGEFSMTVVVIIGAIIIVGVLAAMSPWLSNYVAEKWNDMTKSGENASTDAAGAWSTSTSIELDNLF